MVDRYLLQGEDNFDEATFPKSETEAKELWSKITIGHAEMGLAVRHNLNGLMEAHNVSLLLMDDMGVRDHPGEWCLHAKERWTISGLCYTLYATCSLTRNKYITLTFKSLDSLPRYLYTAYVQYSASTW